jgi:hypothetical protein
MFDKILLLYGKRIKQGKNRIKKKNRAEARGRRGSYEKNGNMYRSLPYK